MGTYKCCQTHDHRQVIKPDYIERALVVIGEKRVFCTTLYWRLVAAATFPLPLGWLILIERYVDLSWVTAWHFQHPCWKAIAVCLILLSFGLTFGQLRKLLLNYLLNSRECNCLTVAGLSFDHALHLARQRGFLRFALQVEDFRATGNCFQKVLLGRIFEPFFTTKRRGKAAALGFEYDLRFCLKTKLAVK